MSMCLRYGITSLLVAAGLTAGCANAPTTPVEPVEPRVQTPPSATEQADALMRRAARTPPPNDSDLRLQAAELYLQDDAIDAAIRALAGVEPERLPARRAVMLDVLRARIALAQDLPLPALNILPTPDPAFGNVTNAEIQRLYAEALFRIGDVPYAVQAMVLRADYLNDAAAQAENRELLWAQLMAVPAAPGMFERTEELDTTTRGWLALARIARSVWSDPAARGDAVTDWRQRFFAHPAAAEFLPRALGRAAEAARPPMRVALLLPQTGAYAGPGTAVRDGFMAAWTESGAIGRIDVYDTASADPLGALQAALARRPDIIVGPLRKEAVDRIMAADTGDTPVLALNQGSRDAGSGRYYQFALSPEEEARQVADMAYDRGLRRVIALVPGTEWGGRSLTAMAERFRTRGGVVLATRTYSPDSRDFSAPIRDVLQLQDSRDRLTAVARALGTRPEFQPRRRNDVDFVFVAAAPETARAIKPQLRFYFASDLPVYATSRVYEGTPDAARDADLEGIIFPDMPWILDTDGVIADMANRVASIWPANAARLGRLYAFGYDAYRLLPILATDGVASGRLIDSATGELYVRPDGTVGHRMVWAQFEGGVPVALKQPETSDAP